VYLKSERALFRGQRRLWWVRLLLIAALLGGGGYAVRSAYQRIVEPLTAGSTPTPMPTPTPAAGYYVAQGEEAYWQGSIADAIAAYQTALDLEPNQTDLYLELAQLLTYQGRPERGLEMVRQALSRQPENALGWALLGLTYDWLGLTRQAVTYCRRAVDLDPTLPEAYAYLAEALVDDGQWFAANQAMETALQLNPTHPVVMRNRAYVLESQGNYYSAIQAYREAAATHGHLVHLHLGIGRNALAVADLQTARVAYEAAVEVDPEHALALAMLGWTQLLGGDYTAARPNLDRALELDPTLPDAYGYLGTLYFHQRNYEDAIVAFRPAIEYAEARSRRRTVHFLITEEPIDGIGLTPQGPEVAVADFVHPADPLAPLRGGFRAAERVAGGELKMGVGGRIRFDVLSGRYTLSLTGIPPAPSGKVYIGWFYDLNTPEGDLVRTEPIFPAPDGRVEVSAATGRVKGPSVLMINSYALSHYLMGECEEAMPLIELALRINPGDEQALGTLSLCR
jgi:tetratricopeptide (TPR) repeat protein